LGSEVFFASRAIASNHDFVPGVLCFCHRGLGKPFAIFGVPMSAPATTDDNNNFYKKTQQNNNNNNNNNSININAFSLRRQRNGDKKGTI
jgi:hypothetical protein